MRFSVVICNYNYASFLGRAIDSALNQTHQDVEVIVVDDGSTDNSREVIESYVGIKSIFKNNGGVTSGLRAALAHITGDIVINLDSDDYLLPHACEVIQQNWQLGVTLFQYKLSMVNNDGNEVGEYPETPFLTADQKKFVLKYGYIPHAPTSGNAYDSAFFRTAFLHNTDRDDTFPDGYLIYTAALYGKVVAIQAFLGVYRIHGSNASSSDGFTSRNRLISKFKTDRAHRIGLSQHAKMLGLSERPWKSYLGPYQWRDALILNRLSPKAQVIADLRRTEMFFQGASKFIWYPEIPLPRRVMNILGMIYIFLAPSSFLGIAFSYLQIDPT
jgi:glycosyltransferase involved in cell wall biosynthesis